MTPSPVKPAIKPAELERVDIRVGTIVEVRDVPGADRLVELVVSANPREIEGRQALFVVNLEARRMMGRVSEGMLLDLGSADGLMPTLAVPESPVPDGTRA